MSLKWWLAQKTLGRELRSPRMKAILDYLRRHKKEVGVLFSMGYIYLQSHPEYDLARELLGVLSGALIGAGAMDSDAAARYKQGITSRADD